MNITQFRKIVESINQAEVASAAVDETKEILLEKNREQMLEGRNKNDDDLSPGYLDDPFFKSREAAQRYSDWKDDITPNPKRKPGVPNLFINGLFHSELKIDVKGLKIDFTSGYIQNEVFEKYDGLMGLGPDKKREYAEILQYFFARRMAAKMGLKH